MTRIVVALLSGFVLAIASAAEAQVVQLPTFQIFSVQTTVVAPDRGWSVLGGAAQARGQQAVQGVPGAARLPWAGRLLGNRGAASELRLAGAAVSATIHDREAMERSLVGTPGIDRANRDPELDRKAAFLTDHVATGAEEMELQSVRAIRARQRLTKSHADEELAGYLARGRAAEAAGRIGAARASYALVARRAQGPLRQEAQSRLDALPRTSKAN
jgi:hypothetical protein